MVSNQGTAQLSRSTVLMLCDSEYDQAGVHTLSRGGVNRFGNTYWSSATAKLLPGDRFDVGQGRFLCCPFLGLYSCGA
jgi:hypothetical protein